MPTIKNDKKKRKTDFKIEEPAPDAAEEKAEDPQP